MVDRFLRLLSEYDWNFSALVVDINGDLSPSDEKEINVSVVALSYCFCEIIYLICWFFNATGSLFNKHQWFVLDRRILLQVERVMKNFPIK